MININRMCLELLCICQINKTYNPGLLPIILFKLWYLLYDLRMADIKIVILRNIDINNKNVEIKFSAHDAFLE